MIRLVIRTKFLLRVIAVGALVFMAIEPQFAGADTSRSPSLNHVPTTLSAANSASANWPFVGAWRGLHPKTQTRQREQNPHNNDDQSGPKRATSVTLNQQKRRRSNDTNLGEVVGLCTCSLIGSRHIITAGHCAERLFRHERDDVKVHFEQRHPETIRHVTACVHAPDHLDVAVCTLANVAGQANERAILNRETYTSSQHGGSAQQVYTVGTYHGLHVEGPKALEYESNGAHLYVSNRGGSGMHAGDSGGPWVQVHPCTNGTSSSIIKFVNASGRISSSAATPTTGEKEGIMVTTTSSRRYLTAVLHGGEGPKDKRRGVAAQVGWKGLKAFISKHVPDAQWGSPGDC
eukprot:UC1_evm5s1729